MTEPDPSIRRLMSIPEACRQLGLGRTSVYALISSGQLNPVKVGRRTLFVASDLDVFISELPRGTMQVARRAEAASVGRQGGNLTPGLAPSSSDAADRTLR